MDRRRLLRPIAGLWALALTSGMCGTSATAATETPAAMLGSLRTEIVLGMETLAEIARRNGLGFVELRAANPGMDAWQPPAGHAILLPTAHLLPDAPHEGIVINLAEFRLYYFPPEGPARTWPISIGAEGRNTPTGTTSIVAKRENPTWVPTPDARARNPALPVSIGPGPNNPLGERALNLGWRHYVIHGTNKPFGIGRRVSSGCIRLYPEHILELFDMVSVGTPVTVVNRPVKLARLPDGIYLEAHPSLEMAEQIERTGQHPDGATASISDALQHIADGPNYRIDWETVEQVLRERRGIPVRISH